MLIRVILVGCLWGGALCSICLAGEAAKEAHLSEVRLKDQDGKEHVYQFPQPKPVVFLLAGRKGSKTVNAWVNPLLKRFDDRIALQGVASLRTLPAFSRPFVRRFISRLTDNPVLLDWKGVFPVLRKDEAMLVLVGTCGRRTLCRVALPSATEQARVFEQIDAVLKESSCALCQRSDAIVRKE